MKKVFFTLFLTILVFQSVSPVYAVEASLRCLPATATYNVGDTFTVDYTMDSRGSEVFGASVVATYDPNTLETLTNQSTSITSVTNWTSPVTNTIDTTLGKITLDYGSSQAAFTGTTSIGQIQFRAKTSGQAQFNFTFFQQNDDTTPGVSKVYGKNDGTTISNVLTDVNNCIYVIDTSTSQNTPTPTPTLFIAPTETPIPAPKISELPRSGIMANTLGFIGFGGLFLILGIVFSKIVER